MYEKTVPRRYLYLLAFIIAFSLAAMILGSDKAEAATLNNPRIVKDSSMESGQKVTWDCVYFGSYPQTEVVCEKDAAVLSNIMNMIRNYMIDYTKVSQTEWDKITGAAYDSNGDAVVNGIKYRRIRSNEVPSASSGISYMYDWNDSEDYHYFRYEPVKWRVLKVNGNTALLMTDRAIDNQPYSGDGISITWENSTIRSYLNGYGRSYNANGKDYSSSNLMDSAFDAKEQSSIKTTYVLNKNSVRYNTNGGNNTNDKIFLLSQAELYAGAEAAAYGFISSNDDIDEAKFCESTTYAKAMGAAVTQNAYNDCYWWTRSPGRETYNAAYIAYGRCEHFGLSATGSSAVRPALNLDISSQVWEYADTVESDSQTTGPYVATGDWSESVKWSLDNEGTLVLEGTGKLSRSTSDDFDVYKDDVKTIKIGSSLTSIGTGTFKNFDSLERVTIPGNIVTVGKSAFQSCDALKYVDIEEGVKTLKEEAFDSPNIKTITIPKSVKNIEMFAFYENIPFEYKLLIKGYSGTKAASYADFWGIKFYDLKSHKYIVSKVTIYSEEPKNYKTASFYIGHPYAKTFQIYRKTSSKSSYKKIKEVNVSDGDYTLNDKKLSFNKKYYYRVKVYIKVSGKKYYSKYSYITVKTKLPKPKYKLRTKSIKKQGKLIRDNLLKWDKVTGATGYRIYTYDYKKKKDVLLADVDSKKRNYIHRSVKKGKRYRYTIRAYRKVNGKKILGAPSTPGEIKDGKIEIPYC